MSQMLLLDAMLKSPVISPVIRNNLITLSADLGLVPDLAAIIERAIGLTSTLLFLVCSGLFIFLVLHFSN